MGITTAGFTELIYLLGNISSPVEFGWIAYGTGTTAEAVGQTALVTEVDRAAASVNLVSVLAPQDTLRFSYVFTAAAAGTITEVAVFNAVTSGDMIGRDLLASADRVTVAVDDKVLVKYEFTLKDGGFSGGTGC